MFTEKSKCSVAETEIVDPRSDYGFKRLFGIEKNKDFTISAINILLADLIKAPVCNVKFISPKKTRKQTSQEPVDLIYPRTNRIPDVKYQKETIVDVLCKDVDGNQFIVEMQRNRVDDFFKRSLFYSCATYADQSKVGGKYEALKRVHCLLFVEHSLLRDEKFYISHFSMANHRSPYRRSYDLTLSFVELDKFDLPAEELHNDLEKWIYFIKYASTTPEDILKQKLGGKSIFSKAYDTLKTSSFTPEELAVYRLEQMQEMAYHSHIAVVQEESERVGIQKGERIGMQKGERIGMQKGEQIGIQKSVRDFVKNMLQNHYLISEICNITGLKVGEIEKLIAEIQSAKSQEPDTESR